MTIQIVEKNITKILIIIWLVCCSSVVWVQCNESADPTDVVIVNKCCEKFEILLDLSCSSANASDTDTFKPVFTSYDGHDNIQVNFKFAVGIPDCKSIQSWPIYSYPGSADTLVLLQDGKLRHYIRKKDDDDETQDDDKNQPMHYDYSQGQYCMEKAVATTNNPRKYNFALVCSPEREIQWTETSFVLRKIINPLLHGISIIILIIVAVIYFILPTLRDLIGNIITTITICLVISQIADLVGIFTELSSHVSFMIADTILYISLLAAFFWLNSFGYYIWKTFRSRNVFLRVTDGRKYCWYSCYAWGATGIMAALAIFANHFLDTTKSKKVHLVDDQETIGWLGIAIFFTPIAVIILMNIFFYVTTLKLINRRNVYGRIQHKLKSNFVMFSLLMCGMTITWLFLILSWLKYDGFLYTHIFVNAMLAPFILYVCVIKQKHVTYLLKKSCCYNDPPTAGEWGDEMNYINTADY